eukprot:CAMPEP_0184661024 /NCGR_PEP_ID=MMETSP0308-20130426/36650_1 /TAXON_ID=38269 /ORGANISM="Gloeochaete witrockiana, Strain SAG 46.84" /LENGTH=531 /DNA_ID=CAMNT_0027102045 /DNA_START=220 /DNA_END=1812 /DNA_ORIENTATION=-
MDILGVRNLVVTRPNRLRLGVEAPTERLSAKQVDRLLKNVTERITESGSALRDKGSLSESVSRSVTPILRSPRTLLPLPEISQECLVQMCADALVKRPAERTNEEVAGLVRWAQSMKYFATLEADLLESLCCRMAYEQFEVGATVFSEGDEAKSMYVIVYGTALVMAKGETLAELGPGESFGDIALVSTKPRSATVAASPSSSLQCISISKDTYNDILRKSRERDIATDLINLQQTFRIFRNLSNRELLTVAYFVKRRSLDRGSILFAQGDAADKAFFIVNGSCTVSILPSSATESSSPTKAKPVGLQVATIGPGEVLGAHEILSHHDNVLRMKTHSSEGARYDVTVTANCRSDILFVSASDMVHNFGSTALEVIRTHSAMVSNWRVQRTDIVNWIRSASALTPVVAPPSTRRQQQQQQPPHGFLRKNSSLPELKIPHTATLQQSSPASPLPFAILCNTNDEDSDSDPPKFVPYTAGFRRSPPPDLTFLTSSHSLPSLQTSQSLPVFSPTTVSMSPTKSYARIPDPINLGW